jgi:hypothetical protein
MNNAANTRMEIDSAKAAAKDWNNRTEMLLMILNRDLHRASGGKASPVTVCGENEDHYGWEGFQCGEARTAEWVVKWANRYLEPTAEVGAVLLTNNRVRVWHWDNPM